MKKLSEILQNVEILNIFGDSENNISSIQFDSRKVILNSIFVAIKGTSSDGNEFIENSIKSGATVIIYDTEIIDKVPEITYILVKDSRTALAQIAQNFYDNPSKKLKLIGVTGTNGKTTTATLLFRIFRSLGYNTALLSTVENRINEKIIEATHTTPDPVALAHFLSDAIENGCTHAFIECSSHAIDQKRIFGLHFAGAIFTNLTLDHLDYHKTLDIYADAKKELFNMLPKTSFAIGNLDDSRSEYMLSETKAKKYFFGIKNTNNSDFVGKVLEQTLEGLTLLINNKKIETKLLGNFNAYNILGVYATSKLLGISDDKIISAIKLLTPPAGRLEFIKSKSGIYGVVDYAHTPDALQNVLKTLRDVTLNNSKIITVLGCGGDRDKTKRSIMGSIAYELSDLVFFTSDNPRNEKPETILKEIVVNLPKNDVKYKCEVDRAKSISLAYQSALPGDIVLIAGKGHETYQVFSNETIYFSDLEELNKNFK